MKKDKDRSSEKSASEKILAAGLPHYQNSYKNIDPSDVLKSKDFNDQQIE